MNEEEEEDSAYARSVQSRGIRLIWFTEDLSTRHDPLRTLISCKPIDNDICSNDVY